MSSSTALYLSDIADINGDGFDDVIALDIPSWNVYNSRTHVFLGSSDMSSTPAFTKSTAPYRLLGAAGDINNDGYDDIYLYYYSSSQTSANLKIIKGAADFDINDDIVIPFTGTSTGVSCIKDINNDGTNDIFLNASNSESYESYVYSGDPTNYINTTDTLMHFIDSDPTYGLRISSIIPADMNGDNDFEYYGNSSMMPYKSCIFIYNNNPGVPLIANFTVDEPSVTLGTLIQFTDLSTGNLTSWQWDFDNDGIIDSEEQNPEWIYDEPGIFTVSLTVSDGTSQDTEIKLDYITVTAEEVIAAYEVSGNHGLSPFEVIFTNQSVGTVESYLWDFGDGETSTEENPVHTFMAPGTYTIVLTVIGYLNTDTAEATIVVETAKPIVTSILDRPNDQGGYVYLNFKKSFYDNVEPGDGAKSTEGYSFQRLDNETWVSLTSIYATGEENYTVELSTLSDSTNVSNGLTSFRVIAGMDEGTWISDSATGYSIDNIAPAIPQDFKGFFVDGNIELQWQPCPDEDFQYYAIYKTDETGQFVETPYSTSISNEISDIAGTIDCSYKVSAFDFNGNQSPTSELLSVQSVEATSGWTSLSSYLTPTAQEMEEILAGLNNELILVQNLSGVYWPAQNINTLGSWNNHSGYFIKSSAEVTFPIIGKKVEDNSLVLNSGWNLIPVLSACPNETSGLFANLDVIIVKEVAGIKIYWPSHGIVTLDELEPGKAYLVLMNNEGTITFPECEVD